MTYGVELSMKLFPNAAMQTEMHVVKMHRISFQISSVINKNWPMYAPATTKKKQIPCSNFMQLPCMILVSSIWTQLCVFSHKRGHRMLHASVPHFIT